LSAEPEPEKELKVPSAMLIEFLPRALQHIVTDFARHETKKLMLQTSDPTLNTFPVTAGLCDKVSVNVRVVTGGAALPAVASHQRAS